MKNFVLLLTLMISLYNALPTDVIVKRSPSVSCWNVFTGLLSLKLKVSKDELTGWYQSLEQGEKETVYLRITELSQGALTNMKATSKPSELQKGMDDLVLKTFDDRKPLIDQVSHFGIDKLALATMAHSEYPIYQSILSQHIKSLPSINGKLINFFGATPAWNDQQMNFVVTAHKAALDMVTKMIDHIQKNPNSKAFTDFFGTSPGAKTAVMNRLQAIQDQEQLNVYLFDGDSQEVAHSVSSGLVDGKGGFGDSLNLMGINIKASTTFFNLPAFPQKGKSKANPSAAGFIIHEVSHMFGTADVSGEFLNYNGLSGVCYGRQTCIDLGGGAVQNPTDAPYNNADSYQFFANEVYLS